jgi:hypothetical protein
MFHSKVWVKKRESVALADMPFNCNLSLKANDTSREQNNDNSNNNDDNDPADIPKKVNETNKTVCEGFAKC